MEGFQVVTLESVVHEVDVFISATGNYDIITVEHMRRMKNNAIVGNIGHFDNEIDMAGLEGFPGIQVENIKPQVDRFVFPDGHGVIVLASGRLMDLGCATGHPSFVMSCSFTNQVLAQLDLLRNWREAKAYKNQVYLLPKALDEKVALLHLPALGAELTRLTREQAEYIGVTTARGPLQGATRTATEEGGGPEFFGGAKIPFGGSLPQKIFPRTSPRTSDLPLRPPLGPPLGPLPFGDPFFPNGFFGAQKNAVTDFGSLLA